MWTKAKTRSRKYHPTVCTDPLLGRSVKVNESTLEVSRKEFERGQELFNVGSIASSDLAQLEAQVSTDKYQLVTAQATLQDYKLQLKQLLELDGEKEMTLYIPTLGDENVLSPLPQRPMSTAPPSPCARKSKQAG